MGIQRHGWSGKNQNPGYLRQWQNDDNRDPHFSPLPSGLLSHSFPFVPIGLSAKEVARMHAEALHSQPSITHAAMDESRSQLQSPQSPATEQRAMTLF